MFHGEASAGYRAHANSPRTDEAEWPDGDTGPHHQPEAAGLRAGHVGFMTAKWYEQRLQEITGGSRQ